MFNRAVRLIEMTEYLEIENRGQGSDNKVWIKSIRCIQEKFHFEEVGVTAPFLIVEFSLFFILINFKTNPSITSQQHLVLELFIWVKSVMVNIVDDS